MAKLQLTQWAAALLVATGSQVIAQNAPPQRPDCSAAEHRQLDFWTGEWDVYQTGTDVRIATSRIESIMNGCAIKESYDAPGAPGGPYAGSSYSSFDRKDRKWHQMYVDVGGAVSWYTGGLDGKNMVMFAPGKAGSRQRMVYSPQPDGSVKQIGVVSTDGGKTWKLGYDYTYRRKNGQASTN